MFKTYKITTNSLMLLGKEVYDLRAVNKKEKQKRGQSRRQIEHG
jgi:hypothetical protein